MSLLRKAGLATVSVALMAGAAPAFAAGPTPAPSPSVPTAKPVATSVPVVTAKATCTSKTEVTVVATATNPADDGQADTLTLSGTSLAGDVYKEYEFPTQPVADGKSITATWTMLAGDIHVAAKGDVGMSKVVSLRPDCSAFGGTTPKPTPTPTPTPTKPAPKAVTAPVLGGRLSWTSGATSATATVTVLNPADALHATQTYRVGLVVAGKTMAKEVTVTDGNKATLTFAGIPCGDVDVAAVNVATKEADQGTFASWCGPTKAQPKPTQPAKPKPTQPAKPKPAQPKGKPGLADTGAGAEGGLAALSLIALGAGAALLRRR